MTQVLGLDLSSKRIAVASSDGWVQLVQLDTSYTNKPHAALDAMRAYAKDWGEPGVAWVEEAVLGVNAKATIVQTYVAGPVMAYLGYLGWDVRLVNNSTWKRVVIGNGGSSKEEIVAWVSTHASEYAEAAWAAEPRSKERRQDLFDATGVMLYGKAHHDV